MDATSQPITKHTHMAKATAGSASHSDTPDVLGTSSKARQSHQPSVSDEEDEGDSHSEDTIIIKVDVNGKEKKQKKNTKSKAAVIDEEDEEDELGKTPLTVAGEATEYYLQSG